LKYVYIDVNNPQGNKNIFTEREFAQLTDSIKLAVDRAVQDRCVPAETYQEKIDFQSNTPPACCGDK
jgi:hypothetical protein